MIRLMSERDRLVTVVPAGGWAPTPLKNMSSSIGMMKSPIYEMENNPNAWNHQPEMVMFNFHSQNLTLW